MKKQWILIGTALAVLALLLVVGCQNSDTGDTGQQVRSQTGLMPQALDFGTSHPIPVYVGEPLEEGLTPEGYPIAMNLYQFITTGKSVAQTAKPNTSHPIPVYEGEPLEEGLSPEGYPIAMNLYQFIAPRTTAPRVLDFGTSHPIAVYVGEPLEEGLSPEGYPIAMNLYQFIPQQ